MNGLLPLLLIGGAMGVALSEPGVRHPAAKTLSEHAVFEPEMGVAGYMQGVVAELRQDPAAAKRGYLAALGDDPENVTLRKRALDYALVEGDIDTALRLSKTLPADEQVFLARLLRIAEAQANGRPDEAEAFLKPLVAQAAKLGVVQGLKAYIGYSKGQKVEKMVAQWQPHASAFQDAQRDYHMARLWLKAGDTEQGLKTLESAVAQNPSALVSTQLLLDMYVRAGALTSATQVQQRFAEVNSGLAPALVWNESPPPFASTATEDMAVIMGDFALLLWAEGALQPAQQMLNIAIWLLEKTQKADAADINLNIFYRSVVQEKLGNLADAEAGYQRVAAHAPGGLALVAQVRAAEVAYQRGQHKQALSDVKVLARQNPEQLMVQQSLAQMAHAEEQFPLAVEAYTRILAAIPVSQTERRAVILYGRGSAYERLRKGAEAEQDLLASLRLNPANPQALNYLGYMWVDQNKNLGAAYVLLKRAHLLAPNDGAITDSVGWAYFRKGDYKTAVAYLERAAEQEPGTPEILDHLADTYAQLGNVAEAKKLWKRALDLAAQGAIVPSPNLVPAIRKKLNQY